MEYNRLNAEYGAYDENIGDGVTISYDGLNCTKTGIDDWRTVIAHTGITSGKWYWEFVPKPKSPYICAGIIKKANPLTYSKIGEIFGAVGAWFSNNSSWKDITYVKALAPEAQTASIYGIAFDADNGKLYFSYDGVWKNGTGVSDPTTGINPDISGIEQDLWLPGFSCISTTTSYQFNFDPAKLNYQPPVGFSPISLDSKEHDTPSSDWKFLFGNTKVNTKNIASLSLFDKSKNNLFNSLKDRNYAHSLTLPLTLSLLNTGAEETNQVSNWTNLVGVLGYRVSGTPGLPNAYIGQNFFYGGENSETTISYQRIDMLASTGLTQDQLNNSSLKAKLSWMQASYSSSEDYATMFLEFKDNNSLFLGRATLPLIIANTTWINRVLEHHIPVDTKYIDIYMHFKRVLTTSCDAYIDDIKLTLEQPDSIRKYYSLKQYKTGDQYEHNSPEAIFDNDSDTICRLYQDCYMPELDLKFTNPVFIDSFLYQGRNISETFRYNENIYAVDSIHTLRVLTGNLKPVKSFRPQTAYFRNYAPIPDKTILHFSNSFQNPSQTQKLNRVTHRSFIKSDNDIEKPFVSGPTIYKNFKIVPGTTADRLIQRGWINGMPKRPNGVRQPTAKQFQILFTDHSSGGHEGHSLFNSVDGLHQTRARVIGSEKFDSIGNRNFYVGNKSISGIFSNLNAAVKGKAVLLDQQTMQVLDQQIGYSFSFKNLNENLTYCIMGYCMDDPSINPIVKHNIKLKHKIYSDFVLELNPYAYYKFDEVSGTTLIDSSSNLRNIANALEGAYTLNSSPLVKGSTRAIHFNNGASIARASLFNTNFASPFAIEFWCKPGTQQDTLPHIISRNSYYADAVSRFPFRVTYDSSPTTKFALSLSAGNDYNMDSEIITNGYPIDIVYHIVINMNAAGNNELWINGVLAGTCPVVSLSNSNLPWMIGAPYHPYPNASGDKDAGFTGSISDVAFYDKVLSNDIIQSHYQAGKLS